MFQKPVKQAGSAVCEFTCRVVDEDRGGASRHVAVRRGERARVLVDPDDLVADRGALLRRDDRGAHEKARPEPAKGLGEGLASESTLSVSRQV